MHKDICKHHSTLISQLLGICVQVLSFVRVVSSLMLQLGLFPKPSSPLYLALTPTKVNFITVCFARACVNISASGCNKMRPTKQLKVNAIWKINPGLLRILVYSLMWLFFF